MGFFGLLPVFGGKKEGILQGKQKSKGNIWERLVPLDKELEQKFYPTLFLDYIRGAAKARGLYGCHFREEEPYREKAAHLQEHFPALAREVLCKSLHSYNSDLGAGPETLENIGLLGRRETLAVVTGQQAGVLGGPLYTFYKAAAAVALAGKLSRQLQAPVVPVFWIAAEDHDFREVNHLYLQDPEGAPRKVELPPRSGPHALEHLPLDREGVLSFLEEFEAQLPETEFKEGILGQVREHLDRSKGLTGWFGRLLTWLFAGSGLVVFNPLMPGLRPLAAPLLADIALKRKEINGVLQAREKEIQALGYPLQVKRQRGHTHLFAFLPGGRAALLWKGGRVGTRQGEDLGTPGEVAAKIRENPGGFGPNVLTRPLVQEVFLPTLSYIGGPGEVSYFAQVMPLYPLFSLKAPVLYPRTSVTLLEPRLADYLERYGLAEEDIFRPREALQAYLQGQGWDTLEEAFARLEGKIKEEYRGLKEELSRVDRGLEALAEKNLGRVLQEAAYLRGRGQQALKEKHRRAVRHFTYLENACLPGGRLQERTYNIFPYLVKYGPGFLQHLRDNLPLEGGHHIHRW